MAPRTIHERKRPPFLMRIPERTKLKTILAQNDMTVSELAQTLKVRRQHLSEVINGTQVIGRNSPLAKNISEFFQIPIDELFPLVDLNKVLKDSAA